MKDKFSVHQAVTTTILKAMEASDGKVTLPWNHHGQGRPINVISRKPYQGVKEFSDWRLPIFSSHCPQ